MDYIDSIFIWILFVQGKSKAMKIVFYQISKYGENAGLENQHLGLKLGTLTLLGSRDLV